MTDKHIVIHASGYDYVSSSIALEALSNAGITFEDWGGSNMTDSMRFYGCVGVTKETLPKNMTAYSQNKKWNGRDGWGSTELFK